MLGTISVLNKKLPLPERTSNTLRVYIGRGSHLGNPFVEGKDGTRAEVIEKFREQLHESFYNINNPNHQQDEEILRITRAYWAGRDVELICHCVPKQCHGEVVKALVENLRKE